MADKIDKIPEATRWEMATKGLTGAYAAISKAYKEALGQESIPAASGISDGGTAPSRA